MEELGSQGGVYTMWCMTEDHCEFTMKKCGWDFININLTME